MRKSKFSEEQISMALRRAETGAPVEEICRKLGVSGAGVAAADDEAIPGSRESLRPRMTVRSPSSRRSLYVNGVEDGGAYSGTGGALAYAGLPARIGSSASGPTASFDGALDEVLFYARALGPGEIRDAMDPCAPVSVPVMGPVGLSLLGSGILRLGMAALRWRAARLAR